MEKEFYKVTYSNGTSQVLCLINTQNYLSIKILLSIMDSLESKMSKVKKKSSEYTKLNTKYRELSSIVKGIGNYFVKDSPLYNAIHNGGILILPKQQGGNQRINIIKL